MTDPAGFFLLLEILAGAAIGIILFGKWVKWWAERQTFLWWG